MDPSQSGTESGGERMMEDEFACAGALRDSLTSQRLSVEKIFRVSFGIGTDDVPTTDGQMWLNLRGASHNVAAAKLFVRGMVNEEQQQEVSYPGFLDCVFCGARGLFMDCLIKTTSAHIVVGSYGCLLISGLTEPVVQAYSLITDLLEKFQGNQGQCTETGSRALGKSLDSSRAFNCLVRKWEDKYTTDLLMLPEVVKQSLLSLVKESVLYSGPGFAGCPPERPDHRAGQGAHGRMTAGAAGLSWDPDARLWPEGSQDADGHGMAHSPAAPRPRAEPPSPAGDPPAKGLIAPPAEDLPTRGTLLPARPTAGGSEAGEGAGAERCLVYAPQEVEASVRLEVVKGTEEAEEENATGDEEVLLSVGSRKEFRLLLKFFTAMGYTEQVVRQVLARTGPREASQILDLVQQEQDRSDKNPEHGGAHAGKGQLGRKNSKPLIDWLKNKSQTQINCTESELGEGDLGEKGLNGRKSKGGLVEAQEPRGADSGRMGLLDPTERSSVRTLEEDFVLAVLKNAAASCGYTEEKVEEVYSTLPDLSTHQLILRLQQEAATLGVTSQEVEEVLDGEGRGLATGEEEIPGIPGGHRTARVAPKGKKPSATRDPLAKPSVATPIPRPEVRGPPLLTYPSGGLDPPAVPHQLPQAGRKAKKTAQSAPSPLAPRAHQPQPHVPCIYPQPFHQAPGHLPLTGPDKTPNPSVPRFPHPSPRPPPPAYEPPALLPPTPAPDPKPRSSGRPDTQQGFPAAAAALAAAGPLVTGEQRFLEGLRETFDLKLPADPGDQGLRMIIIDGSNVAMSHGLGHFFSCRGIALAVQHFWTRGHRRISTFLPQWRQKKDPKIKEQHYLTTLQDLGLLSYTPSREVQGKRINSYDDRFMLQLAQQSDGVIVTNDNLRDLLDESQAWKDIIKKRLLQYTFVGDLFMVPDDPLGRGGPHLDHFLRSEHGTPDPGSHSFAGIASTYPSTKVPRAKTEVLQYRDLTPGGAPEPGQRGSWAAWPMNTEPGRAASPGGPKAAPERGADETARLRESLCHVFPGQDSTVGLVLWRHPAERDINLLSHMVLEQQRG